MKKTECISIIRGVGHNFSEFSNFGLILMVFVTIISLFLHLFELNLTLAASINIKISKNNLSN